MSEKWNSASICIASDSMTPQEIGNFLGLKETRSYEKGEPISRRNPGGPKRTENIWSLKSGVDESISLEFHLEKLAKLIEMKKDKFSFLLSKCQIEIFCGFSSDSGQGGFVLKSDLLKKLTKIPIDIVLDLYPPEADDDDDGKG